MRISFAVMTVFSSGISLYALAKLLETLVHWDYWTCIWVSALIVLVYIFLGGLTSAIYNEVLQFFMIVLGFAPLVFLGLKDVGGWTALKAKLVPVATEHVPAFAPDTWTHSWTHMGHALDNPMGINWPVMVLGLGFVLSFGYWCTDFLVVQRAMAANSMSAARRTPLIAAIPKMLFPALVILPGMIAIVHPAHQRRQIPAARRDDGTPNYNMTIPVMLAHYFPTGLLGHRLHRAHGLLHVRHGRECHRLQHRLDLRYLPELHRQKRIGQTLPLDGPLRHRRRHPDQHRRRLRRSEVQ